MTGTILLATGLFLNVILGLGTAARHRLLRRKPALAKVGITDEMLARHWLIALIGALLPAKDGLEWFATHAGYLYDLDGRERRKFLFNLIALFPRQLVASWYDHARSELSYRPTSIWQQVRYAGIACVDTAVVVVGGIIFLLTRVPWTRALHLRFRRYWLEERRGHVITRRLVRLRTLPQHREFLEQVLSSPKNREFLSGEAASFPGGEVHPPFTYRTVTVRLNVRGRGAS